MLLLWLLSDLLLSFTWGPLLFFSLPRGSHKPPISMETWADRSHEKEWVGLTSVWPFTRGQCQIANMAHGILPYGASTYVLLARPRNLGLVLAASVNRTDLHQNLPCSSSTLINRYLRLFKGDKKNSPWLLCCPCAVGLWKTLSCNNG